MTSAEGCILSSKFIKVRKANKNRDRGIIAIDAICSVFEDSENRVVSIMTMDGFWYDVENTIEEISGMIEGRDKKQAPIARPSKVEYIRSKRFSSATMERAPVNHEGSVSGKPKFASKFVEKKGSRNQEKLGKQTDFSTSVGERPWRDEHGNADQKVCDKSESV